MPDDATLTFRHLMKSVSGFYSGGFLQYRTSGTPWVSAEGLYVAGGPTGRSFDVGGEDIVGAPVWIGNFNDWLLTVLDLSGLAGQEVRLRWIMFDFIGPPCN